VLRLLAYGHFPKEGARHRDVSEGRVKNVVSTIYQKLGLKSQAHLTLYYFGLWHVLMDNGWKPPRGTRD
jgi:DNA-binding NarL/FixJ family response regulator